MQELSKQSVDSLKTAKFEEQNKPHDDQVKQTRTLKLCQSEENISMQDMFIQDNFEYYLQGHSDKKHYRKISEINAQIEVESDNNKQNVEIVSQILLTELNEEQEEEINIVEEEAEKEEEEEEKENENQNQQVDVQLDADEEVVEEEEEEQEDEFFSALTDFISYWDRANHDNKSIKRQISLRQKQQYKQNKHYEKLKQANKYLKHQVNSILSDKSRLQKKYDKLKEQQFKEVILRKIHHKNLQSKYKILKQKYQYTKELLAKEKIDNINNRLALTQEIQKKHKMQFGDRRVITEIYEKEDIDNINSQQNLRYINIRKQITSHKVPRKKQKQKPNTGSGQENKYSHYLGYKNKYNTNQHQSKRANINKKKFQIQRKQKNIDHRASPNNWLNELQRYRTSAENIMFLHRNKYYLLLIHTSTHLYNRNNTKHNIDSLQIDDTPQDDFDISSESIITLSNSEKNEKDDLRHLQHLQKNIEREKRFSFMDYQQRFHTRHSQSVQTLKQKKQRLQLKGKKFKQTSKVHGKTIKTKSFTTMKSVNVSDGGSFFNYRHLSNPKTSLQLDMKTKHQVRRQHPKSTKHDNWATSRNNMFKTKSKSKNFQVQTRVQRKNQGQQRFFRGSYFSPQRCKNLGQFQPKQKKNFGFSNYQ